MNHLFYYIIVFILSLFFIFIIKKFMDIFFKTPIRNNFQLLLWIAYFIAQLYFKLSLNKQPLLLLISNIIFVVILCAVSYSSGWKERFLFSMLICNLWMLIEFITGILLIELGLHKDQLKLPGAIISELFMFLLAVLCNHLISKVNGSEISSRYAIALLSVPTISIYLVHNIFLISFRYEEYNTYAIISSFFLIILNCIVFQIYEWMVKDADTQEKNRLFEQQLDLCIKQADERELINLEMHRIRHDMKHHLASLLGMMYSQDTEQAKSYIADLLEHCPSYNVDDVSRSGNIAMDSLINYKCTLARREGIDFNANVFVSATLPFRTGDLIIILGNLLDNALEGCRSVENGKHFIELSISFQKEVLIISIQNPYEGKRSKTRDGYYQTTKMDSAKHGLGLFSVKQAMKSYNGELQIDEQEGVFITTIILYGNEIQGK